MYGLSSACTSVRRLPAVQVEVQSPCLQNFASGLVLLDAETHTQLTAAHAEAATAATNLAHKKLALEQMTAACCTLQQQVQAKQQGLQASQQEVAVQIAKCGQLQTSLDKQTAQLSIAYAEADAATANLAGKEDSLQQLAALQSTLQQQLLAKQQELQHSQQKTNAQAADCRRLQAALDQQAAELAAQQRRTSETRQRLQANLEAQLKQVTGKSTMCQG